VKKFFGLGKGLGSLIPTTTGAAKPESQKESVFLVELHKIQPNPDQPRKEFDEAALKDLAQSVRKYGILQPLLVSKIETETIKGRDVSYQLIAGERRLRAAKIAGLPRVPVVIRDDPPDGAKSVRLELALIENLQREDLNPMEEARAYDRLQKEFGLNQREISEKVGKSREVVTNSIRLLNLPAVIKTALQEGKIAKAHARALLSFDNAEQQMQVFKQILSGGVSSKDVESMASSAKAVKPSKKTPQKDKRFIELEENLKETLKTPVLIRSDAAGGKIVIRFATLEELNTIAKNIID